MGNAEQQLVFIYEVMFFLVQQEKKCPIRFTIKAKVSRIQPGFI